MGKMAKYFSALLVVFILILMISGCLWDPFDGQVNDTSWQAQRFNFFWPSKGTDVNLQCSGTNGWQPFAKGKTDIIVSVKGVNPLYNLQIDAVIPADCWKEAPTGSPAHYKAQLRFMTGTTQLMTFTSQARNCVLNGAFGDDPNNPDWINRAAQCSTGYTVTLYAQQHNPYQVQANSWNYVFQQQYLDASNYSNRWTGGDGAIQMDLPYCSDCPASDKYRKLWGFGDSIISAIGAANTRVGNSTQFGNTIAITSHGDTNTSLAVDGPKFDWGAKSLAGTSFDSWMPLLMNTCALADMHPLRIATHGYYDYGCSNHGRDSMFQYDGLVGVRVYRSPWDGTTRNDNLIPIYEYYNPWNTFHEYKTFKIANGSLGLIYERIAFWVFQSPQTGTIPLYRYFTNDFSDVLLSTSPDVAGNYGYQDRVLLGYVYPIDTTVVMQKPTTYPLHGYLKPYDPATGIHHKYTTRQNDSGYPAAMWGGCNEIIGNDMLCIFNPVLFNGANAWDWEALEKSVVSIVKGVNRPYDRWGKTDKGDWIGTVEPQPSQYALEPCNATIRWGVFTIKDPNYDTNKFIYVYGYRNIHDEPGQSDPFHYNDVVVARVPCITAEDFVIFSNWKYFSNGSWVSDQESATAIASDVGASSIVKNPNNNHYIIVGGSFLSPIIYIYRSVNPTGPFSLSSSFDLANYFTEAPDCPKDVNNKPQCTYYYYAQVAHKGLSFGGDSQGLMISYVRASNSASANTNPGVYVPRFVNLQWSQIDP
jgi:hypothetical protein